jgi:hypothetical protein
MVRCVDSLRLVIHVHVSVLSEGHNLLLLVALGVSEGELACSLLHWVFNV